MTPYYETKLGKLYHGDCLDIMPQLEPVDLVLTDPPYGVKYTRGKNGFGVCENRPTRDSVDWDIKPSEKYFSLLLKSSKNQIIFGGNYFTDILPPTKGWIFWDKVGNVKAKNPFADGELAWTSFNHVIKKYTCIAIGFISDNKEKRVHPTQKPSGLFVEILSDYSASITLDPFLGSGTTAIACEQLNRKWIGCEISEKYCEIAAKRLEQETAQLKLFN